MRASGEGRGGPKPQPSRLVPADAPLRNGGPSAPRPARRARVPRRPGVGKEKQPKSRPDPGPRLHSSAFLGKAARGGKGQFPPGRLPAKLSVNLKLSVAAHSAARPLAETPPGASGTPRAAPSPPQEPSAPRPAPLQPRSPPGLAGAGPGTPAVLGARRGAPRGAASPAWSRAPPRGAGRGRWLRPGGRLRERGEERAGRCAATPVSGGGAF